ncbi:hypothetical protein B0H14DRAFT_2634624 [Mycena olivaceomarginata]|nr:hypothetical protein B0H14DRAFT_2634624 [Mycena olivaceomarginata]
MDRAVPAPRTDIPRSKPTFVSAISVREHGFCGVHIQTDPEVREQAPSVRVIRFGSAQVVDDSVASELPDTPLFYAVPELVFLRVALNADAPPSVIFGLWPLHFTNSSPAKKKSPTTTPRTSLISWWRCGRVSCRMERLSRFACPTGRESGRTVELWKELRTGSRRAAWMIRLGSPPLSAG